jgi:UDP-glucuronate 4-epimerase
LVERLLESTHEVSVLDDFNDYYDPKLKQENLSGVLGDIEVFHADIRDAAGVDQILAKGKFDLIVHLAARAGVRPSIQQPKLYVDTNIGGTFNLLEAARHHGVSRFIFASSSSVYGLSKTVPFREDFPIVQTISPYASTKIACEQLCSSYSHLYDIRMVCLRFFTVYGPRQRPDLAIHQFTRRIHEGKSIDQFGDGTTRRDYTYIDDIIQGIIGAMAYEGPLFDVFNLGESETTELRSLIRQIEEALGRKAQINFLPDQPGDVPLTCADISKARRLLGYNPSTAISAGIPRFVEWFLDRAERVAAHA